MEDFEQKQPDGGMSSSEVQVSFFFSSKSQLRAWIRMVTVGIGETR